MAQIPDFKVDLERSPYIQLRQYLLTNHQAPKLSHANVNLGTDLATLLFQHCDEALKEDFGLTRPLKGPGEDLWASPSDLLVGKLALKPPFTPKCLQALTHRGILEIGYGLEQKFREEMELDKQRCLEAYKEELLASVEARMKSEIKDVEIRERLNCHMELEKQVKEFETTLKNELKILEEKLQAEHEALLKDQDAQLKEKWTEIMKEEVEQTVKQMTHEFLLQLDEQEEILSRTFGIELRKREALRNFDMKMQKKQTTQALKQLKHKLECTNLVNMMYVMCTEREKCCDQKERIETFYKNEVHKLQKTIEKKDAQLLELEQVRAQKSREIEIREILLTEILKQFQKFINFALKSAPTQAEFLLSVEKMMVFELTNAVTKKEFLNLTDENAVLTWKHGDEKSTTSSEGGSLIAKDFHDCYNELEPPPKDEEEKDAANGMPVVYFKDRRYIRQEFRDILLAGVDLEPSHELWNRDVQILIDTWREEQKEFLSKEKINIKKSVSTEKNKEHHVVEEQKTEDDESEVRKSRSDRKSISRSIRESMGQKSNVQFKTIEGGAVAPQHNLRKSIVVEHSAVHSPTASSKTALDEIFGSKMEFGRWSVSSNDKDGRKLSFRKASLKPVPICKMVTDVEFPEPPECVPQLSGSKLLAARDSVELIKDSKTRHSFLYGEHRKKDSMEDKEILVEIIEDQHSVVTNDSKEDDKLKTLKTFETDLEYTGRQASEEILLENAPHVKSHLEHLSPSKQDLVLETRDSIILQKVSLLKKSSTPDFKVSPVDSVEVTKVMREKSIEGIKKKSSKLTSARNSLTLLRESIAKLNEPSPICIKKNRNDASSTSIGSPSLPFTPCCEKCKREGADSHGGIADDEDKSEERSVKISRVDVIPEEQEGEEEAKMRRRANSAVSFQRQTTVYQPLLEDAAAGDAKVAKKTLSRKGSARSTSSKTKKDPPKAYYDAYPPTRIQVLGNQGAVEGTQSVHEFTADRIHSLVDLMKNEPYLIQLFTACRRIDQKVNCEQETTHLLSNWRLQEHRSSKTRMAGEQHRFGIYYTG